MNIKFLNGTAFEYIDAVETEEFYNGASRRTLTFECEAEAIGVDLLNSVLSNEENTKSITLENAEENAVNIYDDYQLKLKCGIENRLVKSETPDMPAVYTDRLVFKLGKRTYIEEQLKKLGI
ncbi:MAG: hypothetical protein IKA10_03610 [Oscillospiraceae bacterium]|nr:hypothetical protein [Oscillospiraceae bacterium]